MTPVAWTPQALDDVQAIREYIARESAQYGASMAQRFFRAVERLEQFPDSGRMVPEYARPDLREVLEGVYRIVYRRLPNRVEIITVWHGARLLQLEP